MICCFLVCSQILPIVCLAQAQQPTIIRVDSSLVLVDVITQDMKSGLPVVGLKKEDFRIFDDSSEMQIQSFDIGARYATRPIALWFVVICNETNWDENGSGFIRGKVSLLRPPLDHLDANDVLGVAHWCDNQTEGIDFPPSRDLDGGLARLEGIFHQKAKNPANRPGEVALQAMLRLILTHANASEVRPLPVIIFLYGDHSGLERSEADHLLSDTLENSGIIFGINDGAVAVSPVYLNNEHSQPNVAHFLSAMTGGQFFSVKPNMFGLALEDILVQVHFRYVLGFRPNIVDGKVHQLRVELTDAAKEKFTAIRMTYRPAYIPNKKARQP
jgi:hypothetical protein